MELRDIDVNEPAEAPAASPETTEQPAETPAEETLKPAEEPAKAPAEEPAKAQEEVTEPAQAPEQPKRSRAEERIHEINQEKRNLARENAELKARLDAFIGQAAPELNKDEIGVDDLNKVINNRAIEAAQLLIASSQVQNQYQAQVQAWAEDFTKVKADHPQLDPKSPEYDPELDQTLARLLDDGTGNNTPRTDILVSEVLKTLMRRETQAQTKAKEEGKSEATVKLAKQMTEGAITPTAKAPSEVQEYSDDELAEMRVKNPKEYMRIIDRI